MFKLLNKIRNKHKKNEEVKEKIDLIGISFQVKESLKKFSCVYCGKETSKFGKWFSNGYSDRFCSEECERIYKIVLGRNEFQCLLGNSINV